MASCPSCHRFSTMRTLNGTLSVRDRRNGLVRQFLRFVAALLPKFVMMENVPGLATKSQFRCFSKRLAELGYQGDYRVLNAADFGGAQGRRRLICLAAPRSDVNCAEP